MKTTYKNSQFLTFLIRFAALYLIWGVCRVIFALYNGGLIGPVMWSDVLPLVKGGFVFDTVSILYLNIPFILFSLLPAPFVSRVWYQRALLWLFVVVNAIALIPNIGDIFWYQFKLGRFATDDLHFAAEETFGSIVWTSIKQYWWAVVIWLALVAGLVVTARATIYKRAARPLLYQPWARYALKTILLLGMIFYAVSGVRGFVSFFGTFPIGVNDATMFVRPQLSPVALSNPFSLIRTASYKYVSPTFFDRLTADTLAPVGLTVAEEPIVQLAGDPNVVFILLESFGAPYIKEINPELPESYTPNMDSIFRDSYLFVNAFHNGHRSIDALPAVWASIPSLHTNFLSMPQSTSEYYTIVTALRERGYTTQFYHGGARASMSFVSFGAMAGVDEFYSREDYERERGSGHFDGTWGIYDDKFLPYFLEKLNRTTQPFCATIFTVSSHVPFAIPKDVAGRFPGAPSFERSLRYSDWALGEFFREAARQPWFDNTLFVITADHHFASPQSTAIDKRFLTAPYIHSVPIAFYYPGGELVGRDSTIMQHIDIAPTLRNMLGIEKPMFGFGRDHFNDTQREPFALFFNDGRFYYVTEDIMYYMDVKGENAGWEYYTAEPRSEPDMTNLDRLRAIVQQFYGHVERKEFTIY